MDIYHIHTQSRQLATCSSYTDMNHFLATHVDETLVHTQSSRRSAACSNYMDMMENVYYRNSNTYMSRRLVVCSNYNDMNYTPITYVDEALIHTQPTSKLSAACSNYMSMSRGLTMYMHGGDAVHCSCPLVGRFFLIQQYFLGGRKSFAFEGVLARHLVQPLGQAGTHELRRCVGVHECTCMYMNISLVLPLRAPFGHPFRYL